MAPPAKRRRRNAIPSSSPEEAAEEVALNTGQDQLTDLISSSPPTSNDGRPANLIASSKQLPSRAQTKPQTRAKTANHPHNAAPIYLPTHARSRSGTKSASTSPEKQRSKAKIEEKGKSGDIFTIFAKQAQRQAERITNGSKPRARSVSSRASTPKETEDDLISDGDDLAGFKGQSSSFVSLAAQKRHRGVKLLNTGEGDLPSGSQRFSKKPNTTMDVQMEVDSRPWAERFGPINLDELAVHKKKVIDVRTWLEEVTSGRKRQRLLLLKGAAGTGKTTTVQLLAKNMGCEVLEWRNPVGTVGSSEGGSLSMSAQFEEFMGRGGRFGQLDIFSSDETGPPKSDMKPLDRRKNIILIEEFPNTFTRTSTTLQSFRSAVLQYLITNTPPLFMMNQKTPDEFVTPVVMIVSETLLTTSSASADSFTAHRLLGPEILQHPGVGIIEFNAIAPTLLIKALELVVQKESRKSGRRKTPGPMVLKRLAEVGDVRSALGSLEFLCLRGDVDGDWGAKVAFGKGKKGSKDAALTKMEEQSLELVTRREASLGIFHAVGKVVYNKRDDTVLPAQADGDVERLPDFLSHQSRPRRTQVSVDELIDETGTDTQTFVAALHENYILSCDAPPNSYEFSSLDHTGGCIDYLSESDLLSPSWDGSFNSTGFGGGSGGRGSGGDILRQDEICFQVAVRGILFSLPFPVKRKAPAETGLRTGKGGDAFKMFYPTSLKLWRLKEEIESTVDLWVTRLMRGEEQNLTSITAGAAAFARPKPGSVESWKKVRSTAAASETAEPKTTEEGDNANPPLLTIGTSARKEMLLERLPYMLAIARSRRLPTANSSNPALKEMEKVVTFKGIGGPGEEEEEAAVDEEIEARAPVAEDWATDRATEGSLPTKMIVMRSKLGRGGMVGKMEEQQKLVLSDDDIEDD